jgi:hypothetical protein
MKILISQGFALIYIVLVKEIINSMLIISKGCHQLYLIFSL